MCLGQFSLHAEIRFEVRFKKSVASQKTVRTWREGECRSPGTGCLPPWQTNPPIWLVMSEDGAGEDNREHRRLSTNNVSMCLQAKLTVFKHSMTGSN